jgi:transcriptional regulator with PAS, ATPase and Fis domain
MALKPETEQERKIRLAEQDALHDIFETLWPYEPDPIKRDLNDELTSLERVLVQDAMRDARNNKTKAAELLNISRENLIYKLKKLDG